MTGQTQTAGARAFEAASIRPARPLRPRRLGLLVQIAVLLSVALVPIGLVAVLQTQRAFEASREVYLDALRARTIEAATPEREGIQVGVGLLRGVADTLVALDPDDAACVALMAQVGQTNPRILFVGFVEPPGTSRCNSANRVFDFSGNAASAALFAEPRSDVRYNPAGDVSGRPVVVLSEPVRGPDGDFRGFVTLSFPVRAIPDRPDDLEGTPRAEVILFNSRGQILSSSVVEPAGVLPAGRPLEELAQTSPAAFSDLSMGGAARDYTVVTVAPGRAYALGTALARASTYDTSPLLSASLALPLLMWLVSMAVALVSIHLLAIRPIHDLGRRMRGFADGRRILQPGRLRNAPEEITEIGETFETMARKIIRDQADLENTLFERGVLLKEVHHRVKNNLQLMSSILNMQLRKVESPEARRALRDVQDRLHSLAAIHRALYQAPELSQVQFDDLLRDLVGRLVSLAPERLEGHAPDLDLAGVRLVPDQAAPLAMIAAEMITNALKYLGENGSGKRRIGVSLARDETEGGTEIVLSVRNTAPPGATETRPDGLGRQLMVVLTQQLDGTLHAEATDDCYTVSLRFLRANFEPGDA